MTAQLVHQVDFNRISKQRVELNYIDDLILNIGDIFAFVNPKTEISNFQIQISLWQNGRQMFSELPVSDGQYGNEFSSGQVYAVVNNEYLDSIPRGFYQVLLRVTYGDLSRSAFLNKQIHLIEPRILGN